MDTQQPFVQKTFKTKANEFFLENKICSSRPRDTRFSTNFRSKRFAVEYRSRHLYGQRSNIEFVRRYCCIILYYYIFSFYAQKRTRRRFRIGLYNFFIFFS